jgi:hypothetical protein
MLLDSHRMFTGWVTTMFTLQLNVYTVAISSVNKIVINEWLRLNNSGFLMSDSASAGHPMGLPGTSLPIFIALRAVSQYYNPTLRLLFG